MVIFGIDLVLLIPALMISATPVLLAAIGEAVVEESGVLNLGVEGMMITGAVIGFIFAVNTEIPIYGFICAAIAGALLSVLFAVLTQYIMSNQVATGLGLTMVGLGLSALIGKPYEGIRSPTLSKIEIPILSDIPILGLMIFSHDAIVYFSIILAIKLKVSYSNAVYHIVIHSKNYVLTFFGILKCKRMQNLFDFI